MPPGSMGCGAYGASVTGPGLGTFIGAGNGGRASWANINSGIAKRREIVRMSFRLPSYSLSVSDRKRRAFPPVWIEADLMKTILMFLLLAGATQADTIVAP